MKQSNPFHAGEAVRSRISLAHPVSVALPAAQKVRAKKILPHHHIEIKLRDLNQLFNSLDPSPFHEKDLDQRVEEFIVSRVQEYHRHDPVSLVVHVDQTPVEVEAPG